MVLLSVPSATVAFGDRAEQVMAEHVAELEVLGPWSLEASRRFWEGFTPAALASQPTGPGRQDSCKRVVCSSPGGRGSAWLAGARAGWPGCCGEDGPHGFPQVAERGVAPVVAESADQVQPAASFVQGTGIFEHRRFPAGVADRA